MPHATDCADLTEVSDETLSDRGTVSAINTRAMTAQQATRAADTDRPTVTTDVHMVQTRSRRTANATLDSDTDLTSDSDEDDELVDVDCINGTDVDDCEFIISLYIDNKEVRGIQDSGNLGPILVFKDMITPERIIPGKFKLLQGVHGTEH